MLIRFRHMVLATTASLVVAGSALAQGALSERVEVVPGGQVITPAASIEAPDAIGQAAHANVQIFRPDGIGPDATAPSGIYETPASLACLYGLTPKVPGCNPKTLKKVATGGSKIVAIVDAYDSPTATADLVKFSKQFGLPAIKSTNFEVVYASGKKPAADSTGGWELESSLDVQIAHALAPSAKVVLVEANSNSFTDLFAAEKVAAKLVAAAGGGEVSNSWSGAEFSGEQSYAPNFTEAKVVFLAAAGDAAGTGVPSSFPNVVSIGGTTINRGPGGNFKSQTTWSSTGGGLSKYVKRPTYQNAVTSIVGAKRGTPDVSFDANPNTGAWIYDSTPYNGTRYDWLVIGGTSVGTPSMAAIINNAGAFHTSSPSELATIYSKLGHAADFTDVVSGACPNAKSKTASKGYDLCTGVGTPLGRAGK